MNVTEVTLSADVVAQLKNGEQQLKLYDPSGRVLGYFTPTSRRPKSPFSREELERRYREGKDTARPLSGVLAEFERRASGQSQ